MNVKPGDIVFIVGGPKEEIGMVGNVSLISQRALWPVEVILNEKTSYFDAIELKKLLGECEKMSEVTDQSGGMYD